MVGAFAAAPGAAADPSATAAAEAGHARLGETATRLVGVIDQNGGNFVAYGFYTLIAGLSQADLFSAQTDPCRSRKPSSPSTELLRWSSAP